MDVNEKTIFTTGDVAKICKVAPRTVSKWFDSNKLRGYRIPGSQDRRVPRDNLLRFLRDHEMPIPPELRHESGKVRLLLVGAENWSICPINLALPANAYEFREAPNGFDAGILIPEYKPHAIVIDMAMGRKESIEMVRKIRLMPDCAETLIVGLANEDDPDVSRLEDVGFSIATVKPADPAKVVQAVVECCGGGRVLACAGKE